jgi:protein associated with RNAse G/E
VKPYRETGDCCALRGIVNNQVWLAQSVIVVKDTPDETILLLLPGAQCAFPVGYWYWRQNDDHSHLTRWQEAKSDHIKLREFAWHTNRILIFLEPQKYYACCLFWDHASDGFNCFYINFQLPFHRSHAGFDSLDLDLDIVIDPDYTWKWKDVDEYQEGIREGGILREWVEGIDHSQAEVFDIIQKRKYPLDGSWLDWRPDPAWIPPGLPVNWQVV